jgi:hypothetical protein
MKQDNLNELEEQSESLMAEIEKLRQREDEIVREIAALYEKMQTASV